MQTFLPYADFLRSAQVLDVPRLGKQRVETVQVVRSLELYDYGWSTHPAVRMWRGFTPGLVRYGLDVAQIWTDGGRADTTAAMIAEFAPDVVGRTQRDMADDGLMPPWLGDERLHLSHRAALVRKDPDRYRPLFGDDVPDDLPYFWPEPPAAVAELDVPPASHVWVLRAEDADAWSEFRRRRIVGLGTASGIDVDAGDGTADGLRALLRAHDPPRRPTKATRVLAEFVSDVEVGDTVVVPLPDEPDRLALGVVDGRYRFSRSATTRVPHRRPVVWSGVVGREVIEPVAQLQNPRTLFPVRGGVRLAFT
ncbi:MSMEG_6728 family protein [Williamsia serinedens]|uniref:Winged helix DNA-binding domain-containing protein n=1 Tax=Williamsia serinedens TaxID=391736 RepID=A0ABT1H645_9NOCA|nr:MSMEG_6728 family protein [Williamsia serinedens]MCP2162078.1 hypothetical protein [Williamsia serinedens]